ncbi:MAG: cytochrome c oxidase assembly protein [Chloroflexi bacterium]|nr:cytochrome c oxidase assembly protein [Chloroflexota bacterium]
MLPPEPSAVVGVLVGAWLYGSGVRTLWRRAGRGHVVKPWQVVCFALGLLAILVALESPIDSLSDQLFAVHMVQHLLLILIAGPLLVIGAPLAPMLWALPRDSRAPVGAVVRRLVVAAPVALAVHSIALWIWHVPPLYEAAINSRGIHVLEHLCFLVTSALFWWSILHPGRNGYALGGVYVLVLSVQSMLLGALLTFSSGAWYTSHLATTAAWGLSPLEDQQLAGLIMWVPGGVVYLVCALVLFGVWLKQPADTPAPAIHTPVHR